MPGQSVQMSNSERALARVGTTVGKYRIERLVGIGGMGVVYAASHRDGHRVAIKFMLERFRDGVDLAQLFGREAMIANQIGHPGAVPVLAYDEDEDGSAFLVMPLLEGESLRARWERSNRSLPVSGAGAIMADVLDVLAAAHVRGIVHRDIKPDNIFLTMTGEVRVLDYGVARRVDREGTVTITGIMLGTPAFMPPEQALGRREAIGPHSDCWAAGATLFSLLSGEYVHDAQSAQAHLVAAATQPARSLAEVAPNLPQAIVQFVDKSLAFEIRDRWPTAREMRHALLTAFEEALGEPVADVAKRVRVEWIAEWGREGASTQVRSSSPVLPFPMTPPEKASPEEGEAEPPQLDLSGVEVKVRDIGRVASLLSTEYKRIYAAHGFGRETEQGFVLSPGPWWPADKYGALLEAIAASGSAAKIFEFQKLISRYVSSRKGDASFEDIHTAFSLADVRYHASHRKNGRNMFNLETGTMLEGIGHLRYRGEPGENFISLETTSYIPCDFQRGAQFYVARRYEPHALVEHAPGSCTKNGGTRCTYHITWW